MLIASVETKKHLVTAYQVIGLKRRQGGIRVWKVSDGAATTRKVAVNGSKVSARVSRGNRDDHWINGVTRLRVNCLKDFKTSLRPE